MKTTTAEATKRKSQHMAGLEIGAGILYRQPGGGSLKSLSFSCGNSEQVSVLSQGVAVFLREQAATER
jgi:hypothetical protein